MNNNFVVTTACRFLCLCHWQLLGALCFWVVHLCICP